MPKVSGWFRKTKLGEECTWETHCKNCRPNGDCDSCDTIDGRYMPAVNDYASTCDGPCMELTMHERMHMDPVTQLGYCDKCFETLPRRIKARIMKYESSG